MKNVKEEDKHKVMMIEKILKVEVSYEAPLHDGTTFEGGDGQNEENHGRNERKYEKGESYRRFGP